MTSNKTITIPLPPSAKYVKDGTRVAISGTLYHSEEKDDCDLPKSCWLEINRPSDRMWKDTSPIPDDWWVIDAMVTVPRALWEQITGMFAVVDEISQSPDWDIWKDPER